MSYYLNLIKHYECVTGFTTSIKKAMYITQIKYFFKWTNRRKDYEKQILDHNIKKLNLIVRANLNIFFFTKTLTQANQNAILQINLVTATLKIWKIWSSTLKKLSVKGCNIVACTPTTSVQLKQQLTKPVFQN